MIKMPWIIYAPKIIKSRYVHFSFQSQSCAIRDFLANDVVIYRNYSTSEVRELIEDSLQADRVSVADKDFWIKRLKEITQQRLKDGAYIQKKPPEMPSVKKLNLLKRKLENNPNDASLWFQYGNSLWTNKDVL
ncbi:unnamed protein product, partial [marine sediment metagenome]